MIVIPCRENNQKTNRIGDIPYIQTQNGSPCRRFGLGQLQDKHGNDDCKNRIHECFKPICLHDLVYDLNSIKHLNMIKRKNNQHNKFKQILYNIDNKIL